MAANKATKCEVCCKRRVCFNGVCRQCTASKASAVASAPVQLETVPTVARIAAPEIRSLSIGKADPVIASRTCAARRGMDKTAEFSDQWWEYVNVVYGFEREEPVYDELRSRSNSHTETMRTAPYDAHVQAYADRSINARCYSMAEFLSPAAHHVLDDNGQLVDTVPQNDQSARAYRSAWNYFKRYGTQLSIADIASRDSVNESVQDAIVAHLTTGIPFRKALQRSCLRVIRRDGKFKVESNISHGTETLEKALASARNLAIQYGDFDNDFRPALEALRRERKVIGQRMSAKEQKAKERAKAKLARQLSAHTIGNDEIYKSVTERRKENRKEVKAIVSTLSPEAQAKFAKLSKSKRELLARVIYATKIRGRAASGSNKRYGGIHTETADAIGDFLQGQGIVIREDKNGENFAYRLDTTFRRSHNGAQGICKVFVPEFRKDFGEEIKAIGIAPRLTHRHSFACPIVPNYVPYEHESEMFKLYGEAYNRPEWSLFNRPMVPYCDSVMADCDAI